ncbi:hypothetical protein [Corynebacterium sphenisci]|uniref:hypothetical protein n=1 Tax=Corynebacterium sphenisci TaxID=191493 RepID=UPI0026E00570|nr:hypothetical protein [Corynebacterium sphenisci]MDO5730768.1 hypothetical protein [Corynebacterium sphenisci]
MTTRDDQIVQEMIDRLRELQGSGEYVPLGRRVIAGEGLAGGGPLTADVTLSLSAAVTELLQAIDEMGGTSALTTEAELAAAVAPLAPREKVRPRVYYRDFTLMDPPSAAVTSPPIRIDGGCNLRAISVTVGTPGTKPVQVTVGTETVTVARGGSQGNIWVWVGHQAGDLVRVKVGATDAAEIVVSLRFEDAGVSS